jgi:DNA-nicking Smr family endonuclease
MTSKARGKTGGRQRAVTADEAELWQKATRTLDPVKAKPRVGADSHAAAQAPAAASPTGSQAPSAPASRNAERVSVSKPVAANVKPAGRAPPPAPRADFDRRKVRQIASGKIEIDARIDLHGSYQRDAHARLRAFLFAAHANGHKTVLVITGKGGEARSDRRGDHMGDLIGERQRGVLRRNVPLWLAEPDLRAIVLGFTEASVRHGGAGALYVQLRKGSKTR